MTVTEFRRRMEEAVKLLDDEGMIDDQERIIMVPPLAFWTSLPRLPILDTVPN